MLRRSERQCVLYKMNIEREAANPVEKCIRECSYSCNTRPSHLGTLVESGEEKGCSIVDLRSEQKGQLSAGQVRIEYVDTEESV